MKYEKNIENNYDVDVLVAGGGPAGVAAAWACATKGCNVLIIENSGCFGGMGTIGKVPMFTMFTDGVNFLSGGFGKLIYDKCFENDAVSPDDYKDNKLKQGSFSIQAEKLKKIYDDVITKSGAKVLFYTKIIDAVTFDGKVEYAICSGKSSIFSVKAKVYIDCTGDGTFSYYCGAEYEKGDSNGKMQPGTLCTEWSDIDWDKAKQSGNHGLWPTNEKFLDKAFEDGIFSVNDKHLPGIWRTGESTGGGNTGHAVGVDGTDEVSLTRATIEERARIWEYQEYYRKYLSGYENARITGSGEVLGIRETRRIKGLYTLTKEDYLKRADFDDEIGRYSYQIDLHASDSKELKNNMELFKSLCYKPGESYGIPYSSLVPKGFDNLLVAGRCISCDRYMQASIRVMPGCFITGQGAGIAAYLAVKNHQCVYDVNIKWLKEELREIGAFIKEQVFENE